MERIAQWRTAILLALGVGGLASALLTVLFAEQEWGGLLLNLGTEMAGAALTYGLFDLFIARAERQAEKKANLMTQMGSSVRDVAISAADELRQIGWLTDGSLQEALLSGADLRGADLSGADLSGADLSGANLTDEQLAQARSLEGAIMPDGTKHD